MKSKPSREWGGPQKRTVNKKSVWTGICRIRGLPWFRKTGTTDYADYTDFFSCVSCVSWIIITPDTHVDAPSPWDELKLLPQRTPYSPYSPYSPHSPKVPLNSDTLVHWGSRERITGLGYITESQPLPVHLKSCVSPRTTIPITSCVLQSKTGEPLLPQ